MNPLRRIGADLRDAGAREKASDQTLLDVLKVGVPATLGGIAPILGPVQELLRDMPLAALLVATAIPLALAAICSFVVLSHQTEEREPDIVVTRGARATVTSYRFPKAMRFTAKIAFLPLAALGVWQVWRVAPVPSQPPLGGYLCDLKTEKALPVRHVEMQDVAGRTIAEPAPVDDTGFFYFERRPAGWPLAGLRLASSECRTGALSIDGTGPAADGCIGETDREGNRLRHGGPWPVWIVRCE